MGCSSSKPVGGGDVSNEGCERLHLASDDPNLAGRKAELDRIRDSIRYRKRDHPAFPAAVSAPNTTDKVAIATRGDVIKELMALTAVGIDMKSQDRSTRLANFDDGIQRFLDGLCGATPAADDATLPLEQRLINRYKPMIRGTREMTGGGGDTWTEPWWASIPFGGATLNDAAFAYTHMNSGASQYLAQLPPGDGALPAHFGITEADVAHVLPDGVTLASLLAEGRLFACDFSELLADVMEGDARLIDAGIRTAPIALFWATGPVLEDGAAAAAATAAAAVADEATMSATGSATKLLPLAIRLFPKVAGKGTDDEPVFTPPAPPQDGEGQGGGEATSPAWSAAKLFVNNAAIACHTACEHGQGVAVVAPIGASLMRHVSGRHPLQGFMAPFVNQFWAMQLQFAAGLGFKVDRPWVDPIAQRWMPTFHLDRVVDHRKRVPVRGTGKLPQCLVAQDALLLYDAYLQFVRGAVDAIYPDDAALTADEEVQAWGREMVAADGANVHGTCVEGTAGKFETKEQLVDTVASFIYFLSAGHGFDITNWSWYAWIPAEPLHFRLDPPRTAEAAKAITDDAIVAALDEPLGDDAMFQVMGVMAAHQNRTVSRLFTGGPEGHTVPETPHYMRNYPGFEEVGRKWTAALDAADRAIAARNKALAARGGADGWPMEGLQPSFVCLSLWE